MMCECELASENARAYIVLCVGVLYLPDILQ